MKTRALAILVTWLGVGGWLQAQPAYPMYPFPAYPAVAPVAHWSPAYPAYQPTQAWAPPAWSAYQPALPPVMVSPAAPASVSATPALPAAPCGGGPAPQLHPAPQTATAHPNAPCCPPAEPYMHHMPCEPVLHDVRASSPSHYVRAEYLLWFAKKQQAPPVLVIGTPGDPSAAVVGGGSLDFQNDTRHGGRLTFGCWLDMKQTWAIEASLLFWPEHSSKFTASSTGTPILSVPFVNVLTGEASNLILAMPPTPPPLTFSQAGTSEIETRDRLWGAEVNCRRELCRRCRVQVDLLAGIRYLELEEDLNLTNTTTFSAAPIIPSDATIIFSDRFGTRNQFIGPQIGLSSEFNYRCFFVNLWGKAAVGNNHQTVLIDGNTVSRAPPPTLLGNQDLPGGIFTQASNLGRFERDVFAFVPEAGINLGYQCSPQLRVFGGYSILFINNVVRPGEQIDTTINPTANVVLASVFNPVAPPAFVPSPRPAFTFRDSEFWAQGFNLGVEFRY
jgi:hypothetical protein